MMITVILLNLSMALFRSPVIALMPDITPPRFRSQANGIINFMGGLGSLLAFFGGGPLYDTALALPFIVGGLVMLGACLLVVVFIREPAVVETAGEPAGGAKPLSFAASAKELAGNLKDVFTGEKSLLFILLAIFCWFVGYNAIETFFTSYAKFHLGIKESVGTLILGFFSVSFMITAIASGFLGSRFGRRNTIRVGLVVVMAVMLSALFIRSRWPLTAAFVIGGFGWGLVNVNSLPMVVDMTTLEKVGGYTGLYYFFSQAANIVAPPVAGMFIDWLGLPLADVFRRRDVRRGRDHRELRAAGRREEVGRRRFRGRPAAAPIDRPTAPPLSAGCAPSRPSRRRGPGRASTWSCHPGRWRPGRRAPSRASAPPPRARR